MLVDAVLFFELFRALPGILCDRLQMVEEDVGGRNVGADHGEVRCVDCRSPPSRDGCWGVEIRTSKRNGRR